MPIFSASSRQKLSTCHPDLVRLFNAVIEREDIAVICGHRNMRDQNLAFSLKKSNLEWPKSKHNATPSLAADVVPIPVDWKDIGRFEKLSAVIKETADELGIRVRWGGDWKGFRDMPHWELVG